MKLTKKDFIIEFSEKIKQNQASIFMGAGVSKEMGLPTWKELFQKPANKLGLDIEEISAY